MSFPNFCRPGSEEEVLGRLTETIGPGSPSMPSDVSVLEGAEDKAGAEVSLVGAIGDGEGDDAESPPDV